MNPANKLIPHRFGESRGSVPQKGRNPFWNGGLRGCPPLSPLPRCFNARSTRVSEETVGILGVLNSVREVNHRGCPP